MKMDVDDLLSKPRRDSDVTGIIKEGSEAT
jgi:hypothetical protein